ncbi:MAG: hypothetical protein OQK04_17345 [Kangiellaceae bacterium]|nr:hypothetical protein [Kangiellaceae bacterium]MCW9000479.1 hypothetical protein [Kangiellaceae bacterium]
MSQTKRESNKNSLTIGLVVLLSMVTLSVNQLSATESSETVKQSSRISILQSGDQYTRTYVVNGKRFTWSDLTTEQRETISKLEKEIENAERNLMVSERQLEAIEKILEVKADKLEEVTEKLEEIEKLRMTESISVAELEKFALKKEKQALEIAEVMREKEVEMREFEEKIRQLDIIDTTEIDEVAERLDALLVEIAGTIE